MRVELGPPAATADADVATEPLLDPAVTKELAEVMMGELVLVLELVVVVVVVVCVTVKGHETLLLAVDV